MATMTVAGRLGRTAEVKYTSSGAAVAELAVAYNYGRKGDDGNRPTQWVRGSLWGKQAESLAPYLEKGKGVVLTLDDVHVREYQKSDGSMGASLEGRVIAFEFAPSGGEQSGGQYQNQPQQQQSQQPQQQAPQQQQRPPQSQQSYQAPNYQQQDAGPSLDQDDPPW